MRLTPASLALVAVILPTSALPAEWRVDPARSRIGVVVEQGGKAFEARFDRFEAEIAFDPARPDAARVVVVVDTSSFTSDDGQRDQIATGDAFLAAKAFPRARYASRELKPLGGDRYDVRAEFDLRGLVKPVAHLATITTGTDGARATGELEIARADWGVGQLQFRGTDVGPVVTVRFDLAAVPAAPP